MPESQTLQTIVLTDVAGYTDKMRLDEPGTLRQLKLDLEVIRSEFEREGGSIVKIMGDGVYALFPSTPAAVRAALACQGRLVSSTMLHRTAIHVGEVTQSAGDLHGVAVNVSARMEAACPPGAVCASRVVLDMIESQGLPEPTAIRRLTLKGLSAPMEVAIWGGKNPRSFKLPAILVTAVAICVIAFGVLRGEPPTDVAANEMKSFPSTALSHQKTDRTEAEIVENWMDQAFDELWQEIEEYDNVKAEAVQKLDADAVIHWLQTNPLGQRERGKRELEHWQLAKAAIEYGKRRAGPEAKREKIVAAIEANKLPDFEIEKTALLEELAKYR